MNLRNELTANVIDDTFTLASHDAAATPGIDGKQEAKKALDDLADELFDLHEKLFAEEDRSILLVLQGTDASGKNGTIKHVVNRFNPAGIQVSEFAEPTEEEASHHFLWRIEREVPPPGHLGVFSRSHYEDVIVPMALGELSAEDIDSRVDDILGFEQKLIDGGTVIVKCLLHLSYDEQRERFLRRLRRDDKRWKFNEADLDTRRLWDEYQRAFGETIARTSTDAAPWFVVPADHKWYRNWAVATLLVETMREMHLEYPQPDLDLAALRSALDD